jgi:hypothetical protein
MGAAAGIAGKFAGDRILNWATKPRQGPMVMDDVGTLTQQQRNAMSAGESLGMRTTPGQASGSKALQQLEAKLESQPWSSGPFNARKAGNAAVVDKAFLKAIGEEGSQITDDVLQKADARIGSVFEEAAKKNNIVYDDVLQNTLSGIEATAARELPDTEVGVLRKQFQNILDKAAENNGALSGRQYQAIRESLNRLSMSKGSGAGYWARQIRESLDDALERSVGGKASQELRDARQQYRILAIALNRTNAINGAGHVNPGVLSNAIKQADKRGFTFGGNQSDLYKALKFSDAFRPIVGDSGTATRGSQDLWGVLMNSPYNVLSRAYLSKPVTNIAAYAGPTSRFAGDILRRRLGTLPYYAPHVLPSAGGVVAPQLMQQ